MLGSIRLVLATTLALATLGACSILAPSDDELMGGGARDAGKAGTGGKAGSGGKGGATSGGAGGTGATDGGKGGTGAAGGLGATGGGGVETGGTTAGGAAGNGGVPPTGGTGGVTCTPIDQPALARPVAMYLLLDRSASMFAANWNAIVNGISSFVSNQQNSKIEAAFDYFPRANTDCPGTQWSNPTISIAPLAQNGANISQMMNGLGAGTSTNIEGVLRGLAAFGTGYAANHIDGQFSAVLVTDVTQTTAGNPCTSSLSVLAKILVDAWPTVATYIARAPAGDVVFDSLLAAAGGTVDSVGVSTSLSVQTALQQAAVSCRFEIPPGFPVANVKYTLDPSGTPLPLNQVTTASGCGTADGWFVSPTSAQTAILCPASCRKHNAPMAPVAVQVSASCGG